MLGRAEAFVAIVRFMRHLRSLLALAVSLPFASVAAPAGAQEPSVPPEVSGPAPAATAPAPTAGGEDPMYARLAGLLEHERAQAERYRLWGGLAGLAIAGAAIPTGIVLLDHGQSVAGGITLGVGIGAAIGGAVTFVAPQSTYTPVIAAYDTALERGLSHDQVLEATERAWRKQAEAARMVRTIAAPILMILGAGAIGTGVYFGVTNQQVGDLSASDQGAWSATLVAAGGAFVAGGAQALCFASPIESSWEEYRRITGRGGAPEARSLAPRFAVVPIFGGGYVTAGAAF
jgi:hypothetical protein